MQTQQTNPKNLKQLEEQRRKGNFGKQVQEFQKELDMLYETKVKDEKR